MGPAWAVAAGLAAGGFLLRRLVPDEAAWPGASTLALLAGILLVNALGSRGASLRRGAGGVVRRGLPVAIVLLGAGLDFRGLADPRIGVGGLLIILLAVGVGLGASLVAGRLLGVGRRAAWLLGAGTAICGNSAILAAAPAIRADEDDIVLAIAAINVLGVAAMLGIPVLASALGLPEAAAGALAGSTIHAVPQAVAAGDVVGPIGATFASLFKMVRVALLAPFVLLLAMGHGTGKRRLPRVPPFLLLFLLMAAIGTAGGLGANVPGALGALGGATGDLAGLLGGVARLLLAIVLAAIGLQIDVRAFRRAGPRILVAGAIASVVMVAAVTAAVWSWGQAGG